MPQICNYLELNFMIILWLFHYAKRDII